MGYHFSYRLTATVNICLIYFKISWTLSTLLEHMHKKFEINRTKIKGGCQSGREVVTHNSKSDLPLYLVKFTYIFKAVLCFFKEIVFCPLSVIWSTCVSAIFTRVKMNVFTRGKSLLELWVTTFLPNWQPPLIFVQFISNFLCMASDHVILK